MRRKVLWHINTIFIILFSLIMVSCPNDPGPVYNYSPTPFDFPLPDNFPPPRIPENNPLTEEGITLGRRLFYDPIISHDNSFSCSSCHKISNAFTDPVRFSTDIDGNQFDVNTMPLFNLAFYQRYSWNGKIESIEQDVEITISNLHGNWEELLTNLRKDESYVQMFYEAFGEEEIDPGQIQFAISQFVRSIVSYNSRFDSIVAGYESPTLDEMRGFELFFTEEGDCFHCHIDPLFTNLGFHNNALDNDANMNEGYKLVTGNELDMGKFKVPSLRNLIYTAPYMHDGRFASLEDVIDFYSEGLQMSQHADSNMKNVHKGGIQLSEEDKKALLAFLLTLSDHSLVQNPKFDKY